MSEPSPSSSEEEAEHFDVYVPLDQMPLLTHADVHSPRPRRVAMPAFLFIATCVTTFLAGATNWLPFDMIASPQRAQAAIQQNWTQGLIYMAAVIGILLTHEMGHFLQAVRYHVPASFPFFIPMPGMLMGTMGAVISMEGSQADRKQLFDIGISGPLAGLVVAIPVIIWGILSLDPEMLRGAHAPGMHINSPLLITLLVHWLRPDLPLGAELFRNPLLMAGWVGMLITGLNMMPVSQLDGGHVIYGLFGKRAHLVARGFICAVIGAMLYFDNYTWLLMLVLVLMIGIDHPPTRDDDIKLGPLRTIIGLLSLAIPIFCFTPLPF
jgi:membrane-associated protease RseP (regulator of RpoE activity)